MHTQLCALAYVYNRCYISYTYISKVLCMYVATNSATIIGTFVVIFDSFGCTELNELAIIFSQLHCQQLATSFITVKMNQPYMIVQCMLQVIVKSRKLIIQHFSMRILSKSCSLRLFEKFDYSKISCCTVCSLHFSQSML